MTADGGSPTPYSPPGGPFATPPGPSVPPPPAFGSGGGRRSRGVLTAIGVVLAVVLSAAALIVALVRDGASPTPGTPTAQSATPSTSTAGADTTASDKSLCEAVAPLMSESNKQANDWVGLGEQGSRARDAALPKFVTDTKDWAHRAQAVVDGHPGASPFLRRTLQRYIDDLSLYVINVSPGPKQVYDSAAWNDSLVAYGGPRSTCRDLGTNW